MFYTSRPNHDKMSTHAEDRLLQNYYKTEKIIQKIKHGQHIKMKDIFVFRFDFTGKLCNAKPCIHCASKLYASKVIRKVYYTNQNGEILCEKVDDLLKTSEPMTNQSILDMYNGTHAIPSTRFFLKTERIYNVPKNKIGRQRLIGKEMVIKLHQFMADRRQPRPGLRPGPL